MDKLNDFSDGLETTLFIFGETLKKYFLEDLFLKWLFESVYFYQINISFFSKGEIKNFRYNLSPYAQGASPQYPNKQVGLYKCRIVCENPSRTFYIKVQGFSLPLPVAA